MIKKIPDNFWFPFWVDKWIFGSMRLEFEPEERSVWVDLLALAAKDNGYIRANEETPYLTKQLAGLLVYDEEFFDRTIQKFIEKKKLNKDERGILHVITHEKYKLSPGYKRVLKYREKKTKERTVTPAVTKDASSVTHIKSNHIHNITNHIKNTAQNESQIKTEFELFYTNYPRHIARKDAELAFNALRKKVDFRTIEKATMGYIAVLKQKRVNENFEQSPMYPASFLRKEKWKDYVDFSYKPPL